FIKPAERVVVEEQLKECVHVTALRLEPLGHSDADDFADIHIANVEGAIAPTKDLCDFGSEEVLQVVADRLSHAAKLLVGLRQEATVEMFEHREPAWGRMQFSKRLNLLVQPVAVGEQFKSTR